MVSAIKKYVSYWEDVMTKQKSKSHFTIDNAEFKLITPEMIKRHNFNLQYYPQPYHSYLGEDMKNGVLILLTNPGPISDKTVIKQFGSREQSNQEIYERYTGQWNKAIYHKKELWYDDFFKGQSKHWRGRKLRQVGNLLEQDIEFLHTIEFFPFHSDRWSGLSNGEREAIYSLNSSSLSIEAIEEIASQRLVKHILGVGKSWVDILEHYSDKFFREEEPKILLGPSGKKIGQRFYKSNKGIGLYTECVIIYSK